MIAVVLLVAGFGPALPGQHCGKSRLVATNVSVAKDPKVAVMIAEAVLFPIYGEQNIVDQKPYAVESKGDVFVVRGTNEDRHREFEKQYPNGDRVMLAGEFTIEICKGDGRVISITHTRG